MVVTVERVLSRGKWYFAVLNAHESKQRTVRVVLAPKPPTVTEKVTERTCLNDCNGNGKCQENGECHCHPKFTGEDCSISKDKECLKVTGRFTGSSLLQVFVLSCAQATDSTVAASVTAPTTGRAQSVRSERTNVKSWTVTATESAGTESASAPRAGREKPATRVSTVIHHSLLDKPDTALFQ